MKHPHSIRLRGVWAYEVVEDEPAADASAEPLRGTMRLPGGWSQELGSEFRGRLRCRRTFNWPSQLQPGERVWLVLENVARCSVMLNGQPLGASEAAPTARFELTARLARHNELLVEVCLREGVQPLGEVRLEIGDNEQAQAAAGHSP